MSKTATNLKQLFMVFPILAQVQRDQKVFQQAILGMCKRAETERNRQAISTLAPHIAGPERDYYSAISTFGYFPMELDGLCAGDVLRPRLTLSKAVTRAKIGDTDGARALLREASSLAVKGNDPIVFIDTSITGAIVLSNGGQIKPALELLERVYPIVNHAAHAYPVLRPNLVNNIAVLLLELNRYDEAEKLSRIALASPLRNNFPEWLHTATEIAERSTPLSRLYFSVRALNPSPEIAEPAPVEVGEPELLCASATEVVYLDRYKAQKQANSGKGNMDKPTNDASEVDVRQREEMQVEMLALALHDIINDLAYKNGSIPAFHAAKTVLNVLDMTEQESEEIITCSNGLRKPKIIKGAGE
jgi:hypothetical protein